MLISDWSSDVCSSDLICDPKPRRIAPDLAGGLDNREDAVHARMDAGQSTAIGVDRQVTPWRDPPTLRECPALALLPNTPVLQQKDRTNGESIVTPYYCHVGRRSPCCRERLRPRLPGRVDDALRHLRNRTTRNYGAAPQQEHRQGA